MVRAFTGSRHVMAAIFQGAQKSDHVQDLHVFQHPLIGWHGIFSLFDGGQNERIRAQQTFATGEIGCAGHDIDTLRAMARGARLGIELSAIGDIRSKSVPCPECQQQGPEQLRHEFPESGCIHSGALAKVFHLSQYHFDFPCLFLSAASSSAFFRALAFSSSTFLMAAIFSSSAFFRASSRGFLLVSQNCDCLRSLATSSPESAPVRYAASSAFMAFRSSFPAASLIQYKACPLSFLMPSPLAYILPRPYAPAASP